MLVDMVHDNHGEPAFKTRFRNAPLLKSYGYGGVVIPDALAAVPGARRGVVTNGALPNAAAHLHAAIDARVQEALAGGLQVYFYSDALMLPAPLVRANPENYQCTDHSGRLCPGRPAVYEAMAQLVTELFRQWPGAAGLIMRTSEAYPESLPHMTGNPLQTPSCPACRGLSLTHRTAQFITAMHGAVVERAGKVYVHRAWQNTTGPSIHDSPALYRELLELIPDDPHILFSFKFTQGDFWHGRPWNPCISADSRPKWVEFPSAREFEGKGAFPNYQAPIWTGLQNGIAAGGVHSIADIPPDVLGGMWGISRGAGWGGPYLQREEWLDVNVYALGRLSREPRASAAEIARDWAALAFGIPLEHEAVNLIADMLLMSTGVAGALLYVPASADQLRRGILLEPALHDDLLDVEQLWSSARAIAAMPSAEQACQEKLAAAAGAAAMRRMFDSAAPGLPNKSQARDLLGTLVYYESFAGTLAHIFCGFVRYAQWQATQDDRALARQAEHHLQHGQAAWQHHSQRHAMLPGAPSVFNETSLWERTNECLETVG